MSHTISTTPQPRSSSKDKVSSRCLTEHLFTLRSLIHYAFNNDERANQSRFTFVDNPAHLIGSHIKPWRESNNEERLHGANGLLLTPTADHLFDRGFISFEDNGEVLISPVVDVVSLKRMGLDPERPPRPTPFNTDQKHFLNHHRREVFLAATT